jgi:hypothetical protein
VNSNYIYCIKYITDSAAPAVLPATAAAALLSAALTEPPGPAGRMLARSTALGGREGLAVEYHRPGAHTSCWKAYWLDAERVAAVAEVEDA